MGLESRRPKGEQRLNHLSNNPLSDINEAEQLN